MEEMQARTKRDALAGACDIFMAAVVVAGVATILGGVALIFVGKIETGGGYFEDSTVYEVMPTGFLLAGIGLLVTPIAILFVRAIQAWAEQ